MKKTKFIFGSVVALTLLASCNQALPPLEAELYNSITEQLEIVGADNIYGDIHLPEEVEGATITWKSSKPKIVSTQFFDSKAPGVVNRPEEDTVVRLTATIEKDGKGGVYTQDVTVKASPYEIWDEDYCGYLFCHFTGQEGTTDHEQLYFSLADEGQGLNFTDMNNSQPVLRSTVGELGVRDPYICRSAEGDRFFILATDLSINRRGGWGNARGQSASRDGSHNLIMWQSYDLVNWGDPIELPVARDDAGMAWAPEMIYHEETAQYVIFFASSLVNEAKTEKTKPDAIYYVTTRDFVHISEPNILIDNQMDGLNTPRIAIDASLIKIDDYYYSAHKDGDNNVTGGGIRILRTQDIFDAESWEKVCDLDELGLQGKVELTNRQLEGPEWFHYNIDDRANPAIPELGLMGDMYMNGQGYYPLSTTDIEDNTNTNDSWRILDSTDYSFAGLTKRHGSIMRLTYDEIQAIKDNYPNN